MQKKVNTTNKTEVLSHAMACIGEGVIITDIKGYVIFMNATAERLTGWDSTQAMERHFDEIFHLIDFLTKEGIVTPIQKALESVCAVGLQNYSALVKKDGNVIFVSANCSTIVNGSGEIEGAVIVFRDIDRIKHMEEDIRREKNNLKNVLEALPQAICIVDSKLYIKWTNGAFFNVFGIDREDITDVRFGDITNCLNSYENGCTEGEKCLVCKIRKAMKKAFQREKSGNNTILQHVISKGSNLVTLWLRVSFIPLASLNENQRLMVIEDITQQKEYEGKLQKSKEAAEAANRLKSEFLANMSHELRTPLNGIVGMANLLLLSELTEDQKEDAEMIKSSAFELLQIINDILDISKIEAGKLKIVTIEFDLNHLIEDTAKLYAKIASNKNLGFSSMVAPGIPKILTGDPNRLRQILNNLISNAIKFTNKGEISLNVEMQSRTERSVTLKFSVSDTGIGISDKNKDRLFKRFSQVDGSKTRRYGGTGLGLAISKQLVELMHGSIGVSSEAGKGSTFYFTLSFSLEHARAYNSSVLKNIGEMFF